MNIKRHLKKAKSRFNSKLEILAAAFLKETGLSASEARLCQETRDKTLYIWFESLEKRANIADAHPDIKTMFDLLFTYNEACKAFTTEQTAEYQSMVSDFMNKYKDLPNETAEGERPAVGGTPDQLDDRLQD